LRARQLIVAGEDTRPVDEIRFENLSRVNADAAKGVMDTKPGEPIDPKVLDADMRRLYGTGDFEHVNYRIIEEQGKRVLAVDAVEKSWGPNYLRFGLGFSTDLKGDTLFNLLTSYRRTWINSLGAEWRNDLQLGQTSSFISEFYQPLETRRFLFVAPRVELERRLVSLFQGSQRLASYDVRYARAGLDIGSQFTRYGELRLGAITGSLDASLQTGPPSLAPPAGRIQQGAFTSRLIFDQLDSVIFPRTGAAGSMNLFASSATLGADDPYTKWDADGSAAWSFGDSTFNRYRATTCSNGAGSCSNPATRPAPSLRTISRSGASCTTTSSCGRSCSKAFTRGFHSRPDAMARRWFRARRREC
jgi:NTE family protein